MNDTDAQSSPAAPSGAATYHDAGGAPPPASWLDRLREAFGFKTPATLRQDLEEALSQEDALDAAFSPEERALIRNILRLRETRVDDVMVPRTDVEAVPIETSLADLLMRFAGSGHSRMPVFRNTLDDAVGMVHIKDLMTLLIAEAAAGGALDLGSVDLSRPLASTELVRPVLFVPPSMPATDLLTKMQTSRTQIALVIDEFGGTDGLVSLEDLVETIVGEIDDEHDVEDAPLVKAVSPGVYVADARADLEQVAKVVGSRFVAGDHDEHVNTLGGLLFATLGRVPLQGEVIVAEDLPGLEFEVLDADPRRIKTVRLVDAALAPERTQGRIAPPAAGLGA